MQQSDWLHYCYLFVIYAIRYLFAHLIVCTCNLRYINIKHNYYYRYRVAASDATRPSFSQKNNAYSLFLK